MERYYNYTASDVVEQKLRSLPRRPACTFLDERRLLFGTEELHGYLPDQLERIEIIDRGTMVRVYTRRYLQEMLRKCANPGAIVLIQGGLGPVICN
jgi:hypothetical protein